MTGRKGLTWVTALTIASLLLGIGALSALAEGHGGGDHGGATGQTTAAHEQESPHRVGTPGTHEGEDEDTADQDHHRATRTPTPTGTVVRTARGDDDDERATRTATPSTTTPTATPTATTTPGTVTPTATADVERKRARDGNDDEVVTAPAVGAAQGDDAAGD